MNPLDVKVTVDVKQFQLVIEALRKLPTKVAEAIEKRVIRQAMQPVWQSAFNRIRVAKTGNLANSLKIGVRTKNKIYFYGQVYTRHDIAPHAHLVEKGHRMVHGKRGGPQTVSGHVPPHPFLFPAWLQNEAKILALAESELNKELEKAAVK